LLRRALTGRATRQELHDAVAAKPDKYNLRLVRRDDALWGAESTHSLSTALGDERVVRTCVGYLCGSRLYNAERVADNPGLDRVCVRGELLDTRCPLCIEAGLRSPGPDTRQHLFHHCPQTTALRSELPALIADALASCPHFPVPHADAQRIASSAIARADLNSLFNAAKAVKDATLEAQALAFRAGLG